MNLKLLYEILSDTTIQLRKGDVVERGQAGPIAVTTIDFNPPVEAARPDLEKVDLEFLVIGVDRAKAESYRTPLVGLLNTYPRPERLAAGPSYIEVGGVIGDQGAAFQLFALGKTLGLWDVITPGKMGFEGEEARDMAGRGFVMITGYSPTREAA